jgi:hypothetical protein
MLFSRGWIDDWPCATKRTALLSSEDKLVVTVNECYQLKSQLEDPCHPQFSWEWVKPCNSRPDMTWRFVWQDCAWQLAGVSLTTNCTRLLPSSWSVVRSHGTRELRTWSRGRSRISNSLNFLPRNTTRLNTRCSLKVGSPQTREKEWVYSMSVNVKHEIYVWSRFILCLRNICVPWKVLLQTSQQSLCQRDAIEARNQALTTTIVSVIVVIIVIVTMMVGSVHFTFLFIRTLSQQPREHARTK